MRPVTPIEIGEDALENPDSLPQEKCPRGSVALPVVDRPVVDVVDRMLHVATPVVEDEWKELIM